MSQLSGPPTAPLSSPAFAAPLPFFKSSTNLPSGPASLIMNWNTSESPVSTLCSFALAEHHYRTLNRLKTIQPDTQSQETTQHNQAAAPPILTSSGPLLFTAAAMASNKACDFMAQGKRQRGKPVSEQNGCGCKWRTCNPLTIQQQAPGT